MPSHSGDRAEHGFDRRSFLGAGATVGAAALLGTDIATAETTPENTVSIIHDTHFHGRFVGASGVNIAQYTHEVNRLRNERPNAGFVGIGDDFSPSTMGFVFKGEHMVEALNYLDPVVDGVGNHEFDFGIDNAVTQFQNSTFPWVVANLLTPDGNAIPGTQRWTIEEVGDHSVGFFGSGVEDFHSITAYPEDYQVLHPVDAAQEATTALRNAGADVVVMASHTSSDTHDEIAQAVNGLDAIVGSHSGIVQEQIREVSGTLISELGDQFGWLGVLQLDANTGDVVNWERHDLASQADSLPEDEGMAAIKEKWEGLLDDQLGQTVFETSTELDARFATNYSVESNMGNLICDVMRETMDAEIGLQNSGGIRSNDTYGPGGITGAEIYNILPFPNKIVKLEIPGEAIPEILEISVSSLPESSFGIQAGTQVSGVQYEYYGHGDNEIRSFYVGGEPLDPNETYTLATNDYVYYNYTGFEDAELLETTEDFLGTIMIDQLSGEVIDPDTDYRLLRVDEDVGEVEVKSKGWFQFNEDGRPQTIKVGSDEVVVLLDRPDTVEGVYKHTFRAITEFGHEIEADRAVGGEKRIAVYFDEEDLATLGSGPRNIDLRVRGGFEPDDEEYGYEVDGELLDLPVAARNFYFTITGTVPIPGRGAANSWL